MGVQITPGAGKTIASDTVAGIDYQQLKIVDGTVGGTAPAAVTAGNALKVDGSAATQPVQGTGTPGVPQGGVLTVQGAGIGASVPIRMVAVPLGSTMTTQVVGISYGDGPGNPPFGTVPLLHDGQSNAYPQRTPSVFKQAAASAAGTTAIWTPAAGKRFRLMRLEMSLPGNAAQAVAGILTLQLMDAATGVPLAFDVFVPAVPLTTSVTGWRSGWIDLGNGILSAAANNALGLSLSAALTTGSVRVNACGTEE